MDIKFTQQTTRCLGRNGTMTATGLNIFPVTTAKETVIRPITSKGQPGRCEIVVPFENIEIFCQTLKQSASLPPSVHTVHFLTSDTENGLDTSLYATEEELRKGMISVMDAAGGSNKKIKKLIADGEIEEAFLEWQENFKKAPSIPITGENRQSRSSLNNPKMKRLFLCKGIVLPFSLMNGHETTALKSLRLMNKELLVIGLSDVTPAVENFVDEARKNILSAIRELDPKLPGKELPPEEQPVDEFKAKTTAGQKKFDHLTKPATDEVNRHDPNRN